MRKKTRLPDLESPSVTVVAELLSERYHDTEHHDPRNPLWDLVFVILSRQTHEKNYMAAFRELRRSFPTLRCLAEASESKIASAISFGGLSNDKAAQIRGTLDELIQRFRRATLAPLRRWSDEECERFLMDLPGVGTKTARCVMSSAMKREVFAVDTHVWRVSQRLDWVVWTTRKVPSPSDMDRLQDLVPPPLRASLHNNLMSLGREHCTALRPACDRCPLAQMCPKVGVGEEQLPDLPI